MLNNVLSIECPYVSKVILVLECPTRLETAKGLAPLAIKCDICVCRIL